jgi:ABC-type uncharacterized transport system ATPase subunit
MITVQNLCKTYKVAKRKAGMREACRSLFRREYEEIHALDHISFQIEDGETIGYIGPNGAGKSTSIKVLSGILTPDEGTCVVNGKIPWKDRISYVKDIGVIYDICDEVAVMKDGKIEETGEKEAFFANPKTEYGKLMLDSVPTLPYLE